MGILSIIRQKLNLGLTLVVTPIAERVSRGNSAAGMTRADVFRQQRNAPGCCQKPPHNGSYGKLTPSQRVGQRARFNRVRGSLLEKILIDFLDLKNLMLSATDVVADHELCELLAVYENNSLAE